MSSLKIRSSSTLALRDRGVKTFLYGVEDGVVGSSEGLHCLHDVILDDYGDPENMDQNNGQFFAKFILPGSRMPIFLSWRGRSSMWRVIDENTVTGGDHDCATFDEAWHIFAITVAQKKAKTAGERVELVRVLTGLFAEERLEPPEEPEPERFKSEPEPPKPKAFGAFS